MATHKKEPKVEKFAKYVSIIVPTIHPNASENSQAESYLEYFKEGEKWGEWSTVKEIRNESFSHPRIVIVFENGEEHAFVGMPYILADKPTRDQKRPNEIHL